MLTDALLAAAHFLAIFMLIVFITAETTLCRQAWLNTAVIQRLARLDLWYGVSAVLVLLTGFARVYMGAKGADYYWHQPLFHAKLTLFIITALISIKPSLMIRQWYKQQQKQPDFLPNVDQINSARRWMMIQAHLLIILPILASLLARGIGVH